MGRHILSGRAQSPISALNISGTGYTRIKIDVPEEDLPEVMKLVAYGREKVLKVVVSDRNG